MHLNLPVIHQQKNNCNQSSRAGKKSYIEYAGTSAGGHR
jgi:hypothetical protein